MSDAKPDTTREPFPKSLRMIADAIEEAIFDAFGVQPPEGNSRPIRAAVVKRGETENEALSNRTKSTT